MRTLTPSEQLETWLEALKRKDSDECYIIASEIAGLEPDVLPRLVELFTAADTTDDVRCYLADALGRIGDARAVAPLFAYLGTEDSDLSVEVACALTDLNGPEHSVLVAALDDPNPRLRARAADLLGRFRLPGTVQPLIEHAADPDDSVRHWVVTSLGRLRDERGLPTVLRAATDTDAHVRSAAAEALGFFGGAEAFDALLRLARDEGKWVRKWALLTLRDLGDKAAQDACIAATHDTEKEVRMAAVEALEAVGDEKAVSALLRCLEDEYPVCIRATIALGETGGPDVFPDLYRAQQQLDALHMGWRVDNAVARIRERYGLA